MELFRANLSNNKLKLVCNELFERNDMIKLSFSGEKIVLNYSRLHSEEKEWKMVVQFTSSAWSPINERKIFRHIVI